MSCHIVKFKIILSEGMPLPSAAAYANSVQDPTRDFPELQP